MEVNTWTGREKQDGGKEKEALLKVRTAARAYPQHDCGHEAVREDDACAT